MVYFVCDVCNETLKKNQVDKHCYKCRSCQSVTCVDCSVTFYGNDYVNHITCISEAEKYEKSLFKPKVKESSQDAWMNIVEKANDLCPSSSSMKTHMNKLVQFSNIPRNNKKFINFAANSLKISNLIATDLFNYINTFQESKTEKKEIINSDISVKSAEIVSIETNETNINETIIENKSENENENNEKKSKKKKRKHENIEIDNNNDSDVNNNSESVIEIESIIIEKKKKDKKKNKKSKKEHTDDNDE